MARHPNAGRCFLEDIHGLVCSSHGVGHLILWDGECGFCRRSVEWLQRQDARGELEAVPFQMAPSPPMTPELRVACERAVHLVRPDGTILRGGRAVLAALEIVGYRFWGRFLSWPPMIWIIEAGYWVVARNRRWFSRWFFRRPSGGRPNPGSSESPPGEAGASGPPPAK
ncbi:MAG: thiol-disulfide oxidoreductase DCC family protein [Myxococcota bacterium]